MERSGIRMVHVPYKGMGAALQDLVSGDVGVALDISAMAMVRAGKLRALAVAADQRHASEPEIPAFGESGLRGLQLQTFLSLHGPPALPPVVAQRINADLAQVLCLADVVQRIQAMNRDPQGGSVARLSEYLQVARH